MSLKPYWHHVTILKCIHQSRKHSHFWFLFSILLNCTSGRISLDGVINTSKTDFSPFGRSFSSSNSPRFHGQLNSWYLPSDLPTFFFSLFTLIISPFLLSRSSALRVPKAFPFLFTFNPCSSFIHSFWSCSETIKVFPCPSIKFLSLNSFRMAATSHLFGLLWFPGWCTLLSDFVERVLPFPSNFTFFIVSILQW